MDSTQIYTKRLNLVFDYISTHIAEPLTLSRMADIAGFSHFHFHRLFSAVTGETPAGYVNRLRLELAANYLTKTQRPITQITYESGFTNPSDFARAFRLHFGVTPSRYRSGALPVRGLQSAPQTISQSFLLDPPQLETMVDFTVITIACYDGYNIASICRAWERLSRWAVLHHLISPTTQAIGISLDDPLITDQKKCRYYAGMSVPLDAPTSPPVNKMTVPGGLYAKFHTICKGSEIQSVYGSIYRDWLPASGYQPANSFPFEIYLNRPERNPDANFEMLVCIPVEPIARIA